MKMLNLSWKNILHRPANFMLSILLLSLGVGLVFFLIQLDHKVQKQFEKNLAGIDLVLGAKGSPLQLILNSMYHIDAPTGNILLKDARPFLNPKHPLIDKAIPLSLGDSYRGYRIVGTTNDFLDLYKLRIKQGHSIEHHFETLVGAKIAKQFNLKVGDTFQSTHGFMEDEDPSHTHDQSFRVVGILERSGTVADQLIITTNETLIKIHNHSHENHPSHLESSHHAHAHKNHDHTGHFDNTNTAVLELEDEAELTSLLLLFKGRNFQTLNLARNINENTALQAASPAIELNRLFSLMDTGNQILTYLAIAIIIVSSISVFISLYSNLSKRKYELALMRVKGATPQKLFQLIMLEALLTGMLGTLLGYMLSKVALRLTGSNLSSAYKYDFSSFEFLTAEIYVFLGALMISLLAGILPAWQGAKTNIANTLLK